MNNLTISVFAVVLAVLFGVASPSVLCPKCAKAEEIALEGVVLGGDHEAPEAAVVLVNEIVLPDAVVLTHDSDDASPEAVVLSSDSVVLGTGGENELTCSGELHLCIENLCGTHCGGLTGSGCSHECSIRGFRWFYCENTHCKCSC